MLGEGFITRAAANVSNTLKERGITSLSRDGIRNAVEAYVENLGLVAEASEIEAIINNVTLTGGSTVAAAGFTAIPAGKSLKEIMSEVREAVEEMDRYPEDIEWWDEWARDAFVERAERFVNAIADVHDENTQKAKDAFKKVEDNVEAFKKAYDALSEASEVLCEIACELEDEY